MWEEALLEKNHVETAGKDTGVIILIILCVTIDFTVTCILYVFSITKLSQFYCFYLSVLGNPQQLRQYLAYQY